MEKKKKILLIEDDFNTLYFLKEILRENNYECFSSYTACAALEILEDLQPNLILLDLILPRMNGYEMLEELRKKTLVKNIPVVVFSSFTAKIVEEKSLELGAVKYLNKGCDPKELISVISQYAS